MNDGKISVEIDNYFAQIPHWILERGFSSSAIHLYAVLIKYGNWQSKESHPSRRTLAKYMGVTVKTVDRAKDELVTAKVLICERRFKSDGSPSSNAYIVITANPKGVATKTTLPSDKNDIGGGDKNDIQTRTIINENHRTKEIELLSIFEQFWNIYPRPTAKGAARIAFSKALKKTSLEKILSGASRLSDDPNLDPAFTPHPSTWLNQERWDDGPLPGNFTKPRGQTFLENYRQEATQRKELG